MTEMQGGTAADVGAAAEQMADQHGAISQNDAGSGAAERGEGATEQQQDGADDLAAERIAAEARLRSERDLIAYRTALQVAAHSLDRVIVEATAAAGLITWSPGHEQEIRERVAAMAQNLAAFGSQIEVASTARANLTASDQALDPVQEHEDHYTGTLNAVRQVRRQMDGLIAVLGSDVCNTPALVATARAVGEAEYAANVRARGLSIFLERIGAAL